MERKSLRKLFVTRKDKRVAKLYLDIADNYLDLVSEVGMKKGKYTKEGIELFYQAMYLVELAAKRLGYKSMDEMIKYVQKRSK